jgi:hypothetical protein
MRRRPRPWKTHGPAAPRQLDVRIFRIACWRPHTMPYVAGLVMWRGGQRSDAAHGSGPDLRHIFGDYRDERKAIRSLSLRQAGVRPEFVTAQVSNAFALVSRSTST